MSDESYAVASEYTTPYKGGLWLNRGDCRLIADLLETFVLDGGDDADNPLYDRADEFVRLCREVTTPRMSLDVGTRVRLRHDVERYPHFIAPAGATGTVVHVDSYVVSVRMDEHVDGAEAWDNEIVWSLESEDPQQDLEPAIPERLRDDEQKEPRP